MVLHTFLSAGPEATPDRYRRDFGLFERHPIRGPLPDRVTENPERAEASAKAPSGFLVFQDAGQPAKTRSRSRKTTSLSACPTSPHGLPLITRRRGNPPARPTGGRPLGGLGPRSGKPFRRSTPTIPGDRSRRDRPRTDRGSFGIVDWTKARQAERPATPPGDGGPRHRTAVAFGPQRSRTAPPPASADGTPIGVGSPARRRTGREPREG